MTIKYYNPTPKTSKIEYFRKRKAFCENIGLLVRRDGINAMSSRAGIPILNIDGCTVITYRPELRDIPLIEMGGKEEDIRRAKSRLEVLIGIKLKETKRRN